MVGCQVMTKTTAMILMIPIPNTKPKPRLVWNVSGQSGHTYTLHVLGPPCQLQVYLDAEFRIRISFTWFRLSLPSLQSDTWLVCFRHLGVKSIISELVSNYPSLRSFRFANCAESALRFNQLNWATPEIWQPLMAELINIKMWIADGGSAASDHQTAAYQRLERIWIWPEHPHIRVYSNSEVLRFGTCDNEALSTFAYRQFAIRLRFKFPY